MLKKVINESDVKRIIDHIILTEKHLLKAKITTIKGLAI